MYTGHMRRIALVALSFLLLVPAVPLAARGTADTSSCTATGNKDIAHCSIDTLRTWSREIKAYQNQLAKERDAWHLAHDTLGVTTALTQELQAFTLEQQRKMKIFQEQLRSKKKSLEKNRQTKAVTAPKIPSTARPNASASRFAEGQKKCAKYKSESENRACMVPFVRVLDQHGRGVLHTPGT